MKIRIDKDYRIYITCEDLDLYEFNKRIESLIREFGSEKEVSNSSAVKLSSKTAEVSSDKPNKQKRLSDPDVKWLKKEYKTRLERIPDTLSDKKKNERDLHIRKQLAQKLKVSLTAINYWLKREK
jgi:hypothetical protein